jgi:hypothetical protein
MKLAAAHQHRADLGQLTGSAGTAVRLDVDREVLRLRGGCRPKVQGGALYAPRQTERVFVLSRAA